METFRCNVVQILKASTFQPYLVQYLQSQELTEYCSILNNLDYHKLNLDFFLVSS